MARDSERWRGWRMVPAGRWSVAAVLLAAIVAFFGIRPGQVFADSLQGDDRAWQQTRAREPANVTVVAPSWLPALFRTPPIALDQRLFAGIATPAYQVAYHGPGSAIIVFALGAVNSGPPSSREAIPVRGVAGQFEAIQPGWWPEEQVRWQEGSWMGKPLVYTIQAIGVSRADMLHIAARLLSVPVGSVPSGMPTAGEGGDAADGRAAVPLAIWLAGGMLLFAGRSRWRSPWR
jgi:hypothetical protein